MKKTMIKILLTLLFAGVTCCWSKDIPVSPGSDLGQMMREMDRKARASQNAAVFTRALQVYQKKTLGMDEPLEFSSLEEPAESIAGKKAIYIMHARCGKDGVELRFRVRIRFKDAARTVAKSVKVIERLSDAEKVTEAQTDDK